MRIICPSCESHYDIDAENIAAAGQLVRCGQCREVWLVAAPVKAVQASGVGGVEPIRTPPQAAARNPDAGTEAFAAPIDFQAARARLRPWLGQVVADDTARNTLGALAVGLLSLASLAATIAFLQRIATV